MSKTFYALTAGCYSDYRIIDITDNKERAEKLQRLYNWGRENYEWDRMRIEEFSDNEEEHGLTVHLSKDAKIVGFDEGNVYNTEQNTVYEKENGTYAIYTVVEDIECASVVANAVFQYYKSFKNEESE